MAGLTSEGLTIKRLQDIIDSLKLNATTLFQDLVPVGDTVDTSDGTLLGRLIGVVSPDYADLWEAIQQDYSAFDPNSTFGIAMDNLFQLNALTRFPASASTAYLILKGDYLTTIPVSNTVSSSTTGKQFKTNTEVVLNGIGAIGVEINLSSVTNSTLYQIYITDGVVSRTIPFTSDSSATQSEIIAGLQAAVTSVAGTLLTPSVNVDTLVIDCVNQFSNFTWTLTGPLQFTKISKLVNSKCEENGPNEQQIGSIDTISTPVLGWDSVTNPVIAIVGRNAETDEEFRLRARDSKYVLGSNIAEALYSDLNTLEGIEKVIILQNDTNSTDANGILAHSYMAIIQGGLDTEIGQVIWNNKPSGIAPSGNVTVSVKDIQGLTQTVKFKRPTPVRIYIALDITTFDDFPVDGESQIKQAVVNYIKSNNSIGDDVIYSRLYTPINSVVGFEVNSLFVDDSASPVATTNVSIDFDEIASLEVGDISVSIT